MTYLSGEEKEIVFYKKIDEKTRLLGEETWFASDLCEIRFFIERRRGQFWREIGHADIMVEENQEKAKINDILIGSRNGRYIIYDERRQRPENIELYEKFRGAGIGTKVVIVILQHLKKHGIKQVYGYLSEIDDRTKTKNFWQKLGFTLEEKCITKKL